MNIVKLKQKYDFLYNKLSNLLKDRNFCEFDLEGLCKRSRILLKEGHDKKNIKFCCCGNPKKIIPRNSKEFCKYFVKGKGCSTNSIACKLWFCKEVTLPRNIKRKMNRIKRRAKRNGFLIFRGNFNNFLGEKINEL